MPNKPIVPGDLFARAQVINGLRQLADFLEAHPAVPVSEYGHDLLIFPGSRCPEPAQRAHLEAVAQLMGATPVDETGRGGHLWASRTFGRITYKICHIPQQAKDARNARASYEHNIVLDLGTEAA